MMRAVPFVVFSTVLVLVLAGKSAGQSQAERDAPKMHASTIQGKSDDQQIAPTLVEAWRADSISVALADGRHKTHAAADDKPVSVIFTDKSCTMRVGGTVLPSMSYVLDAKRVPWTIDVKSKEDSLLGICPQRGDDLKISLDEQANGRARDFDKEKHGLVLVLRRFSASFLLTMNADGSNPRRIDPRQILAMPELTFVGSPKWSHDGTKIAFDGQRSVIGETFGDAHVFVAHADGSAAKDLGAGAMPSWSPDDKQFTYCRYGAERGVWIMHADGSDGRLVDAGGWGSQWSPKGNEIAYTIDDERGAVLCIYDVARNQRRKLPHKPYRQIYGGITWSPDGKWIGFKGVLPDGGCEISAVSVEGEKKGFKVLLPSSARPEVENANNTISWGGTGKQILVCMQRKSDRVQRLYVLDAGGLAPPRLLPSFPAGWACGGGDPAWSWGGKSVIMSANPAQAGSR